MFNLPNDNNNLMIIIFLKKKKCYSTLLRVADNWVMVLLKLMYLNTYGEDKQLH